MLLQRGSAEAGAGFIWLAPRSSGFVTKEVPEMAQCAQCGREIQGRALEYDNRQFDTEGCVADYRRDKDTQAV